VTERPELDEFERQIEALKRNALIARVSKRGETQLSALTVEQVAELMRDDAGYYFLLAAAGLNRTSLKRATEDHEASIVESGKRRAFAVRKRLPVRRAFADIASSAIALRRGDLERKSRGAIETLFRDRLAAEGIPILMSPPVRQVPGILVGKRKPDGVYPNPLSGQPPIVYLEIKNVRRVADDIQKRLYEIAEASLEMKLLYGRLRLNGLGIRDVNDVVLTPDKFRAKLRKQIAASFPKTVVLMLCPRAEAERYRDGAQAFVDRVFFQEEIEECLQYLKKVAVDCTT
jgi:hypothetical protein